MSKINAVCVYCGSSPGTDPAFVKAARDFGKILAENGVRLVYGGGSIGLMERSRVLWLSAVERRLASSPNS